MLFLNFSLKSFILRKQFQEKKRGWCVFSTVDIAQGHIYIIIVFLVIKINKLTEMSRVETV